MAVILYQIGTPSQCKQPPSPRSTIAVRARAQVDSSEHLNFLWMRRYCAVPSFASRKHEYRIAVALLLTAHIAQSVTVNVLVATPLGAGACLKHGSEYSPLECPVGIARCKTLKLQWTALWRKRTVKSGPNVLLIEAGVNTNER